MLKTEKNSWSESSICSFHYHITSSAWPGKADISEAAGCTIALKAPFPSSSPRYEISLAFAYMHTQEDAGKNAMTNGEAGQASISNWVSACRPSARHNYRIIWTGWHRADENEVKIMYFNINSTNCSDICKKKRQGKLLKCQAIIIIIINHNILITSSNTSQCHRHDSSLTISAHSFPQRHQGAFENQFTTLILDICQADRIWHHYARIWYSGSFPPNDLIFLYKRIKGKILILLLLDTKHVKISPSEINNRLYRLV